MQEHYSIGQVLREVGASAKDLLHSEADLARAELKEATSRLGKHSAQAAVFGAMVAISVLPFLAFLVIGLGNILDGRYWLSSLIVALVCAGVGGFFAFRAYKKLKAQDLTLPHTRRSLERGKDAVVDRVSEVKSTAQDQARSVISLSSSDVSESLPEQRRAS